MTRWQPAPRSLPCTIKPPYSPRPDLLARWLEDLNATMSAFRLVPPASSVRCGAPLLPFSPSARYQPFIPFYGAPSERACTPSGIVCFITLINFQELERARGPCPALPCPSRPFPSRSILASLRVDSSGTCRRLGTRPVRASPTASRAPPLPCISFANEFLPRLALRCRFAAFRGCRGLNATRWHGAHCLADPPRPGRTTPNAPNAQISSKPQINILDTRAESSGRKPRWRRYDAESS